MSIPPPNTVWSKIEKALDSHQVVTEETQLHILSTRTPEHKRKPRDQLSSEKDKDKSRKQIKTTSNQISPIKMPTGTPAPTTTTTSTNMATSLEQVNGTRPKMLRIPAHQLPDQECVAAYTTKYAILTKDAHHKEEEVLEKTVDDVIRILNDAVIALEHSIILIIDTAAKEVFINLLSKPDSQINAFFSAGSNDLKDLCNTIFTGIFAFIAKSEPFTQATGGGQLHIDASHRITESIIASLSETILKRKEAFLRTVLSPVKNDAQNKPLVELIINGTNYDNIWKEAIFTLNVKKSLVSPHTLSLKVASIEQKVSKHEHNYVEVDNQIAKIATRLGDLKSSEMEQRFKALENDIRIHNVNTIDEGTDHHFRALSHTDQMKRIHKLVSEHLTTKNASFSTQIFSPRKGSKFFEALAYVKFSSPALKFEFEKNFANYKRNNTLCKLSTSRPAPPYAKSDRDLPSISDIKTKIGLLYNQAIHYAKTKNPNLVFNELSQSDIEKLPVTRKEKHKPFQLYYEFLCPTNNTTFMPYTLNSNPFFEYDFTEHIPNPVTRQYAVTDKSYEKRFPPRTYNKK